MIATRLFLLASLATLVALPIVAHGVTSFDFTDASGAPLSTLNVGGIGSTFDVYVRYTTDASHDAANVFFGFDRATASGMSATPLDGVFELNGDLDAAVSDESADLDFLFGSASTSAALAGGADDDGPSRPYGVDVPFSVPFGSGQTIAGASNSPLLKISLKNVGLATGSYDLTLFDGGADAGFSYTSYVLSSGDAVRPGTRTLAIQAQAVPEPASLAAFSIGAFGLWRRRRKAAS